MKTGDRANIDATLPFLSEGQREDVHFAETRWAKPAGYGVLFANGTGTGKTILGLGAIKRMVRQGKDNVLVVVPNEAVISAWVQDGKFLDLDVTPLKGTQDAGSGVSVTTYANLASNDTLISRTWDLVVADEAHLLMNNAQAETTTALERLQAITGHRDSAYMRAEMKHPEVVRRMKQARLEKRDPAAEDVAEWRAAVERERAELESGQGEKRPRALFLSATPFGYEKNTKWAEGYLFEFDRAERGGYNAPSGFEAFMVRHFGYRMRYNKLTEPDSEVNRDVMQRGFNSYLRKQGVLSTRMLDVPHDYERKFILVDDAVGHKIDEGMKYLREHQNGRFSALGDVMRERFDALARARLLQSIKARASVRLIKEHQALGRKVVVFYDYNEGGGSNVFNFSDLLPREDRVVLRGGGSVSIGALAREFQRARPDLWQLDFRGYGSPLETLLQAFPQAGVYNGQTQYKRSRLQAIQNFNDDAQPGKNLLLVQKAANAGWSGHDTTGKHPRVLINLGQPTAPIEAIQQEGRIYRTGQASDALFQYLNTGTDWERYTFATKIASRASTAENLAMGEQARGLKEAIIQAFLDTEENYTPRIGEGKGGKAADARMTSVLSDWDVAKSLYFAQQKKTQRNKASEGVDYFATPEPLGLKMAQWADIRPGDSVLEPSAGHGAIARWFRPDARRRLIEPSLELSGRAALASDGEIVNERFENHDIHNKYDAIVMNPPFGTAGKTAFDHLVKAFGHLKEGGRVVALVPRGSAMDRRVEKWLYGVDEKGKPNAPEVRLRAEVLLPQSTFGRAGTQVSTRILVIDRNPENAPPGDVRKLDFSDLEKNAELFDALEDVGMAGRGANVKESRGTEANGQAAGQLRAELRRSIGRFDAMEAAGREGIAGGVRVVDRQSELPKGLLGKNSNAEESRDARGRLLAPNGKPSNLNEMQWRQVRSPKFKRWFGDWEKNALREFLNGPVVASMRGDEVPRFDKLTKLAEWVGSYYSRQFDGSVRNAFLGEIVIDERGAKSSISHGMGAIKGQAFYLIPEVLKNGRILSSEGGLHGDEALVGHVIGAPVSIGVKEYVAIALVREDSNKHGFYLHEAVLREKFQAASKTGATQETVQSDGAAKPGTIRRILQNIYSVNPGDVSKVLDENGEPLALYHGTDTEFTKFDRDTIGKRFPYSVGFHFASRAVETDAYTRKALDPRSGPRDGANVLPVFLNIRSPVDVETKQVSASMEIDLNKDRFASDLAANDVDGIIVRRNRGDEWDGLNAVVKEPDQIKSAIGNTGEFSPDNPDIRYSADGRIRGVYDGKTTWMVAENIPPGRGMGVLLHEGTHRTAKTDESGRLTQLLGRDFAPLARDFRAILKRGDAIARRVEQHVQGLMDRGELNPAHADEERIAYAVEFYTNSVRPELVEGRSGGVRGLTSSPRTMSAAFKAWVQRVIGALRRAVLNGPFGNVARRFGLALTPRDLAAMAREMVESDHFAGSGKMVKDRFVDANKTSDVMKASRAETAPSPVSTQERGLDPTDPEAVFAHLDAAMQKGTWARQKDWIFEKWGTMGDAGRRAWMGALSVDQLVDTMRRILPRAEEYKRIAEEMAAARGRVIDEADKIAVDWRKLPKQELDRVAETMHQARLTGVDPIAGEYRPLVDPKAVQEDIVKLRRRIKSHPGQDNSKLFAEIDRLQASVRQEARRKSEAANVIALYQALTPEARAVFQRAKKFHEDQMNRVEAALVETIRKSALAGKARREAIAKLKKEFETMRVTGPYFPLYREGKYWVSYREQPGADAGFSMFKTREQAKKFGAEIISGGGEVMASGYRIENLQQVDGVPVDFVAGVESVLETMGDHPAVEAARDAVWQLYLQSLPDLSARKHQIHAKKTAGFGKDALLAFSNKAVHDAYHYARVKHGFELRQAMTELNKDLTAANGGRAEKEARLRLEDLEFFKDRVMGKMTGAEVADEAAKWAGKALKAQEDVQTLEQWKRFQKLAEKYGYGDEAHQAIGRMIQGIDAKLNTLRAEGMRESDEFRQLQERKKELREFRGQVVSKMDAWEMRQMLAQMEYDAGESREVEEVARRWKLFKRWMNDWAKAGDIPERVRREMETLQLRLESIEKVREQPWGKETGGQMYDELQLAYAHLMQPNSSAIANIMNQMGFLWGMAFRPASWLTNAAQTPMIAMPYVSAKFGIGPTTREFTRAYKELLGAVGYQWKSDLSAKQPMEWGTIRSTLNDPEEIKAYEFAEQRGKIDRTRTMDLMGMAEEGANRASWRRHVATAMAFGQHHTELANREVTFMAAFRLARQKMPQQEAIDYAMRALDETHLNYAAENRPRFMRSNLARTMLQFRLYSQGMTYLYGRAAMRSLKLTGATPEEIQEARWFLLNSVPGILQFAGIKGLPLGLIWLAAIMALDGADDEPRDWEADTRQFLADKIGPEAGAWLWKGAFNSTSIPFLPPIDMHSRTSLSELWYHDPDRELQDAGEWWRDLAEQAAGPSVGLFGRFAEAIDQANHGETWRAAENASPGAISSVLKAIRYHREGATTRQGDVLIEDTTAAEEFFQAIGYKPARLADLQDAHMRSRNLQERIKSRGEKLTRDMRDAIRKDDGEAKAEAMEKIKAFNAKNPEKAVTGQRIGSSVRAWSKNRALAAQGIIGDRELSGRTKQDWAVR